MQAILSIFDILTDPATLIQFGGLVIILSVIYLETGFFIGLVLPGGDYLLFVAGLLCGTEYLDIPFYLLLPSMMAAAIMGDYTGYAKGRWLGPKLFDKEENRFFKPSFLVKTRSFYERHGIRAFILGRFMPVIRTLIPMLAGASHMSFQRFSFVNIIGGITWVGTLTPIGYYLGNEYPHILKYKFWFLLAFIIMASFPMLKLLLGKRKKME